MAAANYSQDDMDRNDSSWGDGGDTERQPLISHQSAFPRDEAEDMAESEVYSTQAIAAVGRPSYVTQFITAIAATFGAWSMGAALGFSSPASILVGNNTEFNLSDDQITWFSSTLNLGALAGAPLGGIGMNYIGRKGTILLTCLPLLLSWGLMIFATNFAMLITARVVSGLSCSLVCVTVPAYIGEFSSAEIRGLLGTGFQLMVTIGILYVYSMGAFIEEFKWLAASCVAPVVVYGISMLFMKESPVFLTWKGKEQQARLALQHFRGSEYDINREVDMMKASIEEARINKASLKDLKSHHIMMPLFISVALMLFQQFCGINAVLFNLTSIFEAANSSVESSIASIIVGAMQVVATLVGALLMDRAGRKLLLLVSSAVMTISLVALGVYFYIEESEKDTAVNIGWLPLASLIIFITAFSVGFGPIPWLMMGELFPNNIKELAGSIATLSNWLFSFVVTALFTPLRSAIGDAGVYWFFAGWCILSFIFCAFFVIETKGKTLDEISAAFGRPNIATRKTDHRN